VVQGELEDLPVLRRDPAGRGRKDGPPFASRGPCWSRTGFLSAAGSRAPTSCGAGMDHSGARYPITRPPLRTISRPSSESTSSENSSSDISNTLRWEMPWGAISWPSFAMSAINPVRVRRCTQGRKRWHGPRCSRRGKGLSPCCGPTRLSYASTWRRPRPGLAADVIPVFQVHVSALRQVVTLRSSPFPYFDIPCPWTRHAKRFPYPRIVFRSSLS